MPIGNGGIIGPRNVPNPAIAKGVWTLPEVILARQAGLWPTGILPSVVYTDNTFVTFGSGTSGPFSFSNRAIGTANATRYVLVGTQFSGAAQGTVSALTVGGNAATPLINTPVTVVVNGGMALHIIAVPSGTTATIAVTPTVNVFRCAIGVWALYDIMSATPVSVQGAEGPTSASVTLNVPPGGIVAGYSLAFRGSSGAVPTHDWTGAAEDFETTVTANFSTHSGASASLPAGNAALNLACAYTNVPSGGGAIRGVSFF